MDEREALKKELEQELQWITYRQRMLDIMEQKLLQMKQLTEKAKHDNLIEKELELINVKLKDLVMQVKSLDSESRKNEDWKIIK